MRLAFYITACALASVIFVGSLDWSALFKLPTPDLWGLGAFVLLATISQAMAVESIVGAAKPVKISIAYLPLLAMSAVFPTAAVVVAVGIMTLTHELFFRGGRVWKRLVFNTSQTILSYGIGSYLFTTLLSQWEGYGRFDTSVSLPDAFFPFYGLAAAFFVLNLVFVSTYVAIRESQSFLSIAREAAGRGGGNLFYDLLAAPIALFAAYLYVHFELPGLLSVVLPLLLIRFSYLSSLQVQKANRDLLTVLIKAIETRDPYTSGHSMRVSTLAKNIAEDYGLRGTEISRIETAALLHDIGKIDALYAEIISKSSTLTNAERDIIRTHATKGADLLQTLTSLDRDIIVGVRHHHERYDGEGYPDGLRGKDIPLAARIIMICDAVDAMLSDRPYRDALSISQVRAELTRCASSQFDPDLVETILGHNTLERAELLVDRSGARQSKTLAVAAAI